MSLEVSSIENSMSVISLIANAGVVVQFVMLILLLASLISWYMIDRKRSAYKRLNNIADQFENQFWSGGEMQQIYDDWSEHPEGIATIFIAGYREYNRLPQKSNANDADATTTVQRAMRVALSREITELENHLSFLATVGSTSPYIGLFGTVWGIMNSFRAIGTLQQVTIATVAPGISEALIATAMGLFAAIPAVIAYNRFANTTEQLSNRYEMFIDEFLSIVNRQNR